MQDGRNDLRGMGRNGGEYNEHRDWFFQSVRLANAFTKKGYDLNYTWGIGQHNGSKQGGSIFPDMMRWLWRDHAVSTDPNDQEERSFYAAVEKARETGSSTNDSPAATSAKK
jgi:enterochelin esterase family protein